MQVRALRSVIHHRLYFTLTFLACLGLYFLTPSLPAIGDGILFGAAGVMIFALLFLERAIAMLQRRPLTNAGLAGVALVAVLSVVGVHRSLYNFAPTPAMTEHMAFNEQAERVTFVEQRPDEAGTDRVVATFPKQFWLLKTFALNVLLLVVAAALGDLLSRQVEKASHLWAIVILSAVMDLWSVTAGVTAQIVASPSACYYFLLNWPLAGQGGVTYPLIGATDFLFVALFLFLVHKFQLVPARNVIGLAVAMALAVLSAVILGRGVPALPYLGAAMLIINFRAVLPERRELLQIAVGAAVSLGIFSVLWRVM